MWRLVRRTVCQSEGATVSYAVLLVWMMRTGSSLHWLVPKLHHITVVAI